MLGSLAVICLLIALFFLMGIAKPANGIPANVAAIRLLLMAAAITCLAFICWFQLLARRRPLLRICREGLEVNIIGRGSLDHLPLMPIWVKLVWLVLSFQGFRKQIGWISWEAYRGVTVAGSAVKRTLTVHGAVAEPTFGGQSATTTIRDHALFHATEFRDPLDVIAMAIKTTSEQSASWGSLPSLHDLQ